MNHRYLVMFTVAIGLISTLSTLGWELPLKEVGHTNCKGVYRNNLPESCKAEILENGKISDETKEFASLFFSALRGTSYETPHDENSGSHPSLDIATNQGTPVYAIQDGEVVKAGYLEGYGNSITIEHAFEDTVIYSSYSHLDAILVDEGEQIEQGEEIGSVGRSGFTMGTYGYHLDFQITTADSPSHPYGFHDCIGSSYFDTVNLGLCKDKLQKYTIDPLEFFKTYADIDLAPVIAQDAELREEGEGAVHTTAPDPVAVTPPKGFDQLRQRLAQRNDPNKEDDDEIEEDVDTIPATSPNVIHHIEVVDSEYPDSILTVDKRFRVRWSLSDYNEELHQGEFTTLRVYVDDLLGNPYEGKLPSKINITSSGDGIGVVPGSVQHIYAGTKNIFLRLREAGTYTLTLSYGNQHLGEIDIEVHK